MTKSATRYALTDISKHLRNTHSLDQLLYIVQPSNFNRRECSKLNRELGIHKINK